MKKILLINLLLTVLFTNNCSAGVATAAAGAAAASSASRASSNRRHSQADIGCGEVKAIIQISGGWASSGNPGVIIGVDECIGFWNQECRTYTFAQYVKVKTNQENAKVIGIDTYNRYIYVTWED